MPLLMPLQARDLGSGLAPADKALALIARDIAKRRKALAPKLAEHRREQRALRRSVTR